MVEASVCSALSHYRITNAESMRLLLDAGARIEEKGPGADDDGAVLGQKLVDLEEIAFRPQCASPANGGSAPCENTKKKEDDAPWMNTNSTTMGLTESEMR